MRFRSLFGILNRTSDWWLEKAKSSHPFTFFSIARLYWVRPDNKFYCFLIIAAFSGRFWSSQLIHRRVKHRWLHHITKVHFSDSFGGAKVRILSRSLTLLNWLWKFARKLSPSKRRRKSSIKHSRWLSSCSRWTRIDRCTKWIQLKARCRSSAIFSVRNLSQSSYQTLIKSKSFVLTVVSCTACEAWVCRHAQGR